VQRRLPRHPGSSYHLCSTYIDQGNLVDVRDCFHNTAVSLLTPDNGGPRVRGIECVLTRTIMFFFMAVRWIGDASPLLQKKRVPSLPNRDRGNYRASGIKRGSDVMIPSHQSRSRSHRHRFLHDNRCGIVRSAPAKVVIIPFRCTP